MRDLFKRAIAENPDEAAARILAESGQLRQLQLLNLDQNALTRPGIAHFIVAGVRPSTINQHVPDDDYLYDGDME